MGTEAQALSAGYPLMRYGLAEYNAVIDYQPKTENAKSVPEAYRFIASNIKGCYVSWSRSLPSGEVRIGSDIYLSIPNGWDERLCYYPWYTGHRYWQYNQWDYPEQNYENSSITPKGARNNESVYRYYHGNETNLSVYRNRNRFTDKLLVWYKKSANIVENEQLSPSLVDPPLSDDKRLVIRMKIFVQNSYESVTFRLVPTMKFGTIKCDFGDSSYDTIKFGTPSTGGKNPDVDNIAFMHTYSSPGYYIVDMFTETTEDSSGMSIRNYAGGVPVVWGDSRRCLRDLYIYAKYDFNSLNLGPCEDVDNIYIYGYVNDSLDIILTSTSINNLYILGSYKYVSFKEGSINNNYIRNLYLGSYVDRLDVSGFYGLSPTVEGGTPLVDYDLHIYSYSLSPLKIIDYNQYDTTIDNYRYNHSSGWPMNLYVKPAVIGESRDLNVGFDISVF